jgi:hypothetical protein
MVFEMTTPITESDTAADLGNPRAAVARGAAGAGESPTLGGWNTDTVGVPGSDDLLGRVPAPPILSRRHPMVQRPRHVPDDKETE